MDVENKLHSSSEDYSAENNVLNVKNKRRLSVNIINWTLIIIASCVVTFVITNNNYSGSKVTLNHNRILLETVDRNLKDSAVHRSEDPITNSPTEEPTIQYTHSPDFLSAAPTPTLSHAPNFLSAAPSPSYTHAPDYPKTMPPSQEGRKLQHHIITEPTLEPTEMVYKTRSPNHYRTREPTSAEESSTNVLTYKKRSIKQIKVPGSHSSEPTEEPTSAPVPTISFPTIWSPTPYPTPEPTPLAPAVYKTHQPTLTKSPNKKYTHHPTSEKRNLKG